MKPVKSSPSEIRQDFSARMFLLGLAYRARLALSMTFVFWIRESSSSLLALIGGERKSSEITKHLAKVASDVLLSRGSTISLGCQVITLRKRIQCNIY